MLCVLLLAGAASAEEPSARAAARAHYRAGMAFYVIGRFEQAIREFEAGFAAAPEPAFIFNMGQAHARLGHKQQALDLYRAYLDMQPRDEDVAAVQALIDRLERELAQPSVAPVALEPSPSPSPAAAVVMVRAPASPPSRKRRAWPIAVGVAVGLVALGLTVGLAVGLTQGQEPSLLLSAR